MCPARTRRKQRRPSVAEARTVVLAGHGLPRLLAPPARPEAGPQVPRAVWQGLAAPGMVLRRRLKITRCDFLPPREAPKGPRAKGAKGCESGQGSPLGRNRLGAGTRCQARHSIYNWAAKSRETTQSSVPQGRILAVPAPRAQEERLACWLPPLPLRPQKTLPCYVWGLDRLPLSPFFFNLAKSPTGSTGRLTAPMGQVQGAEHRTCWDAVGPVGVRGTQDKRLTPTKLGRVVARDTAPQALS